MREPKFTKKTFDHLPEEKQQLILSTATREFAQNGYERTNINVIAEKAGISVGSLYNSRVGSSLEFEAISRLSC